MNKEEKNIVFYMNDLTKSIINISTSENEYGAIIKAVLQNNDELMLSDIDNMFYWKITEKMKHILLKNNIEYYNSNTLETYNKL